MVLLLLTLVGLTSITNVQPAPSAFTNSGVSGIISFLNEDRPTAKVETPKFPIITNRFPILEDSGQNWGLVIDGSKSDEEDDAIYNKPIHIPKISEDEGSSTHRKEPKLQLDIDISTRDIAKPKRSFPKLNLGTKTERVVGKTPYFCDISRLKCCINNVIPENCLSVRECADINATNMCNPALLGDALNRIMSKTSNK